jgi:hypothetical protein
VKWLIFWAPRRFKTHYEEDWETRIFSLPSESGAVYVDGLNAPFLFVRELPKVKPPPVLLERKGKAKDGDKEQVEDQDQEQNGDQRQVENQDQDRNEDQDRNNDQNRHTVTSMLKKTTAVSWSETPLKIVWPHGLSPYRIEHLTDLARDEVLSARNNQKDLFRILPAWVRLGHNDHYNGDLALLVATRGEQATVFVVPRLPTTIYDCPP